MGAGELILILLIALLVFGPKKLPDLAKGLGKAIREFRRASSELHDQIAVDAELGEAVREVQAAASGSPSPAELAAARRAYDEAAPAASGEASAGAPRPESGPQAEAAAPTVTAKPSAGGDADGPAAPPAEPTSDKPPA